jgi:hypothetical protein
MASPFETLKAESFGPFGELFRLLKEKDKDCPEPDCDKILSSCCGLELNSVFGSYPLTVQCSGCKKEFLLRSVFKSTE